MMSVIDNIFNWFKKAVPEPNHKNIHTQIGVHFEEVAEMLLALSGNDDQTEVLLHNAYLYNHLLANHLKSNGDVLDLDMSNQKKIDLLDALCDQVVTATGVGYMLNMKFPAALEEVNASNYSKFVNGEPIFNENKKIMKGPNYFKPSLEFHI
jgi:predicted HAD superfamily Cof-like phosphohydrolase